MNEDKEGIGCLGWLGIWSWASFLIVFLTYVTGDQNEVFGYFDALGVIILGSPIAYLTKLYKKDNISFLIKFILITTLFLSLISLLGIINRIFKGEENIGHNYVLLYSSFAFLSSSLIIYFAYYKPWIKKKNITKQKEKAFEKLNSEGQKEVSKANTDFVNKMKSIHGNRFDYSNVIVEEFLGVDLKSNSVNIKYHDVIKLSCNEHNFRFSESLQEAFNTEGCERCKLDKRHEKALDKEKNKRTHKGLTNNEIINKLNEATDGRYDFSKFIFNGMNKKAVVTCRLHGDFYTSPIRLLKGGGICPLCSSSSGWTSSDEAVGGFNEIKVKIPEKITVSEGDSKEFKTTLKEIQDLIGEIKVASEQTLKTVNRIDKNMGVLAKIEGLKVNSDDTNIEETISNIVNLIKDKYDFKDVKEYIESVTKWFKYWDKLESLSQDFMVQSEYLYSSIKSSEFDDYSPFVLYSCRALEYELLQKIFVGYHDYINAKYTEKEILFDYDKESLNSKTLKDIETGIINSFKRYIISGNPKYTLGDMRLLLNILPSKSKPKGSKRFQALLALQELNDFIETKIGDIPSKFIKDIENISSNYRNPSAHIGVINKQKADEFYEIYKKMMNDLLSGFDQSNISPK